MVVIPLASVLGAGLYVVIGGMTGFCPICVAILDAFDGGEQQAVPVSMTNDGFTGIKAGHVDGLVFTDLDGVEVPLSRFAGRPMLIEVWATWCAPCRKVRKQLKSIAGELALSFPAAFAGMGLGSSATLNAPDSNRYFSKGHGT